MTTPVNIVSIEFGIPPLSLTNADVVTLIVKDVATGLQLSDITEADGDATIADAIAGMYADNDWAEP